MERAKQTMEHKIGMTAKEAVVYNNKQGLRNMIGRQDDIADTEDHQMKRSALAASEPVRDLDPIATGAIDLDTRQIAERKIKDGKGLSYNARDASSNGGTSKN